MSDIEPPTPPVALILYNRAELTRVVFEAIRAARPARLFLIADGPRPVPGDSERCAAARAATNAIDWTCDARRLFADANMGCGRRVASGLDWVFAQVDEAIILEDDCLPAVGFFRYCGELLERHRDCERVMMIAGTNPLDEWRADVQSYHFARQALAWGWATWRRAWRHFDFDIRRWADDDARATLRRALDDDQQFERFREILDRVAMRNDDVWDYQWSFAYLVNDGLAAVPARNMVTNLGFGAGATHTGARSLLNEVLARSEPAFPLRPPPSIEADRDFDRRVHEFLTGRPSAPALRDLAARLLVRGRRVQALAVLRFAQGRFPDDAPLAALRVGALQGLGRVGLGTTTGIDSSER